MVTTAREDFPPLTQGDDEAVSFTFTDETDAPIDITGWVVWLTFKETTDAPDSEAAIQAVARSHDDPRAGQTSVHLSATETASLSGNYHWDVQVRTQGGDIHTVVTGRAYIGPDVTESTT